MPFRFSSGTIELHHEREKSAIHIVADGAIAHPGVGEGRLIPLVIVDTSSRPDLEEYIRVHQYVPAGDVKCQWGQLLGHTDTVALVLSFSRPSELVAIIEFDLKRHHGVLVEQVLASKGLYIQAGRKGDRLIHDMNLPKVILEIPDTGFRRIWDKIYYRYTMTQLRERGLNRADAKQAARQAVETLRTMATVRLGDGIQRKDHSH